MLTSVTHPLAAANWLSQKKKESRPDELGAAATYTQGVSAVGLGPSGYNLGQVQPSNAWAAGVGVSAGATLGASAVGAGAAALAGGVMGAALGAIGGAFAGLGVASRPVSMPVPATIPPDPEQEVRQLATAFDNGHQTIAETEGYLAVGGVRIKRRGAVT